MMIIDINVKTGERTEREMTLDEIAALPINKKTDTEGDYKSAMQAYLDAKAKEFGYDNILSACTYADDPTVLLFQHQGQAFRAWRSQVWAFGYALLEKVSTGAVPQPTVAELVAQLPSVTVPNA